MGEMTMTQSENDVQLDYTGVNLKKKVKITAEIPAHLHIVAKRMYAIQGKRMGSRIEALLRSDLKRMLRTESFKSLPEIDISLFKAIIDSDMKSFYGNESHLDDEEED